MAQDIQAPGEVFADTLSGVPKSVRDYRNIRFKPTDDPRSWGNVRVLDFTSFMQNESVDGMKTLGAPTVAIDANGRLDVQAVWNSANWVFFPGWTFAEGIFRARIIRGAFMIRFLNKFRSGRAIWSTTGATLEVGYIDSAFNVTSIGAPSALAGIAGNLIWVELLIGPMVNTAIISGRSWVDGAARPALPQVSGPFTATINGIEQNRGFVAVSSFAGSSKYDRLVFLDGQGGDVQANGQAAFVGRWFPRFDGYHVCQATVRGGDKFRFYVTGTASVSARYSSTLGVVSALTPVADVFVNGVRTGGPINFVSPGGLGTIVLASGLDPAATYAIEVRVRGVHEFNDKWLKGAGLLIESLNPGAGKVSPWPDDRPKMLFIGDSITEGIVGRSNSGGSTPTNSAGDESWPVLAAETLGVQAVVNGFGGTGLTIAGSGGMPSADSNAFFYMKDRAIDAQTENIKFIVINLGTNDSGAGVLAATFQTALEAFIRKCLLTYAGVQAIFVMRPLNGVYATQISAAVTNVADNRVFYIDTSTWSTITYTDSLHPNVAGHVAAAGYFVAAVGAMQSAGLT